MNSLSRTHSKDDCEPSRKFHKECDVLLKCGNLGSATIPSYSTTPVTVTSLTVNTSRFQNPCTKLEFTSNIAVTAGATAGFTLSFQIFKICTNQLVAVPVGPSFNFNQPTGAAGTDAFTFFVCDCDSCFNDCCTYTVVVTPTGGAGSGSGIVTNATLAAIVVDNTSQCGC